MPGAAGFSNRAVSSAHGAACALGAILARLAAANAAAAAAAPAGNPDDGSSSPSLPPPPGARAWTALSADALPSALSFVTAAIGHPVSLLHVAACVAVGRVGAVGPLPVRSASPAAVAAEASSGGGGDGGGAEDGRGTASVEAVFERLWAACTLGETSDASRRTEAAAEALGRCCRGDGGGAEDEKASARVRKTLRVLFDMAKNQVCVGKEERHEGAYYARSGCRRTRAPCSVVFVLLERQISDALEYSLCAASSGRV